ncbi:ester hydrolase c11orf54-like protein [Lasius niger]|uniref:Ester hydrolase c11orf54-like protein n=1 Tax=Lasius niger TaxID=67767 RepID=A0A0J7K5S5_LASNI|nr:ester hydrolase c11orf54-like protein [Lasius niger]
MEYLPKDFEALDDVEDKDDDLKYKNHDFDYERTSWNSATLKDVRDVLYKLHDYFDHFEIALVACPCLKKSPYNLDFAGLSGNMYIEELKSPVNMLHPNITVPQAGPIPFRSNRNFYSDGKPGMVLKIRARGRRTDHSIITLIQSILHKRFSYKMGLGGVLLMIGGRVARHIPETFPLVLSERYLDCNPAVSAICTIVNNPVLFLYQEDDLPEDGDLYYLDTNNSPTVIQNYESHCFFGNEHGLFVNDVTPKDTEYVGYFNVAEKVYRV